MLKKLVLLGVLSVPFHTLALCVNTQETKLRRGPNRNVYPITMTTIQYTPLEKISEKNGWYRVKDVDHVIHWVRSDLVSTDIQCAVVKDTFANLRSGPGKEYSTIQASDGEPLKAEKYMAFKVVSQKEEWVEVEDQDGDRAWVFKPLVWIP